MHIRYGLHHTAFGPCLLAISQHGVCRLAFVERVNAAGAVALLRESWPKARITRDELATERICARIFGMHTRGGRMRPRGAKVPLDVQGTPFQLKVWQALSAIPAGSTRSYAEIAAAIGSPRAVRAVGTACGENPVAYLIPCHRVLTSAGGLGGFRWGLPRKVALLEAEGITVKLPRGATAAPVVDGAPTETKKAKARVR